MARGDTIVPPDTSKVPIAHLKGIAASFGFDPNRVTAILMTPHEVVVTCRTDPPGGFIEHRIPVTRG